MAIVLPPKNPDEKGTSAILNRVQKERGFELPRDYVQLSMTYGTGEFRLAPRMTPLVFLNPASQTYRKDLASYQAIYRELREERDADDEFPFKIYPAKNGLLYIGSSEERIAIFYRTAGNPDDWPIVVWTRERTWVELEQGLIAFVVNLVSGKLQDQFGDWFVLKTKGKRDAITFECRNSDVSIHDAVMVGDEAAIASIGSKNKSDLNSIGAIGLTPLCLADKTATVRLLLSLGADPNTADASGYTPLMSAARLSLPLEATKLLLRHGADVDSQNKDGKTALMYAAEAGCLEIVNLLIQRGANARLETADKETALSFAGKNSAIRKAILAKR